MIEAVWHDLFSLGEGLLAGGFASRTKSGLLSYVKTYFTATAEAIRHLGPRLKVEAWVGDVMAVLEQMRHGAKDHRRPQSSLCAGAGDVQGTALGTVMENTPANTERFPISYDKMYLSNIPDYIGGSLSTILYALPVLNKGKPCYATSNCLRNPPRFRPWSLYHNGYVGISTPADLKRVFQFRAIIDDWLSFMNSISTTEYMKFYHEPKTLTSTTRMAHDQLRKCLFRMFFKLAIPRIATLKVTC